MKTTFERAFKLYLSLSILAGTLGVILGAGLVAQAEATTTTTERPVCSDIASQIGIQRAAEAIAKDPTNLEQTANVLSSLVESTVEQTVQCVAPNTNVD
jgi:hypothetical protein